MALAATIYAEQLLPRGYGYPLWHPEPNGAEGEIFIGQIGYIWRGSFHSLFNVTSITHPANRAGLPTDFVPLTYPPGLLWNPAGRLLSDETICSESVKRTDGSVGIGANSALVFVDPHLNLSFECSAKKGGLLVVSGGGAQQEMLRPNWIVPEYIFRHHGSWYAFAKDQLGLALRPEEIVFVRGTIKASEWTVAAFMDHSVRQELSLQVGDGTFVSAAASVSRSLATSMPVEHRTSPLNLEAVAGPNTSNDMPSGPQKNQCVFVSRYMIRYRSAPRRDKVYGEGTERESYLSDWRWPWQNNRPDGSRSSGSGPRRSDDSDSLLHRGSASGTGSTRNDGLENEIALEDHFESGDGSNMSLVEDSPSTMVSDPLDIILDYILEKSTCKAALASDEDVRTLRKLAYDVYSDSFAELLHFSRIPVITSPHYHGLGILGLDEIAHPSWGPTRGSASEVPPSYPERHDTDSGDVLGAMFNGSASLQLTPNDDIMILDDVESLPEYDAKVAPQQLYPSMLILPTIFIRLDLWERVWNSPPPPYSATPYDTSELLNTQTVDIIVADRFTTSGVIVTEKNGRMELDDSPCNAQLIAQAPAWAGRGAWEHFLYIARPYVRALLVNALSLGPMNVMLHSTSVQRNLIKTTMWADVMQSVTGRHSPYFLDIYRQLFSPTAIAHIADRERHGGSILTTSPQELSMLPIMGCENRIFLAIAEISHLDNWKREQARYMSLDYTVLQYLGVEILEKHIISSIPVGREATQHSTNDLLRASAQLYLQSVLFDDRRSHPVIIRSVGLVIESLRRLRVDDAPSSRALIRSVMFAVCIAGCLTNSQEDREYLTTLLDSQQSSYSKNAAQVKRLMGQVWERQARTRMEPVPWRGILREAQIELSLF